MVNRSSMPKRPRDPNQLAKLVVDLATDEQKGSGRDPNDGKNPHAVALGRLGGLKGGKARAERLSDDRRSEIARNAALTRWAARKD
jgi:hypothetical protein